MRRYFEVTRRQKMNEHQKEKKKMWAKKIFVIDGRCLQIWFLDIRAAFGDASTILIGTLNK